MVSGVLVTKSSYCVFMYELMMHDPGFSPCLYRGGTGSGMAGTSAAE